MARAKATSPTAKPAPGRPVEPVTDVLRDGRAALDAIFIPRSVAVIGATETPGSLGRTLMWNLLTNPFGGAVYPVNPKRSNVLGVRAFPSVGAVPELVDLAVIATPATSVPAVVAECVEAKVRGAIVISAGFKEVGPQGVELERRILEEARRGHLRVIGPNCLGVMNPKSGLNATFASEMALPGSIAFISQSGALCTSVLDWSLREHVGFSAFVSIGSMLDVGWGDLIQYLGDDPRTRSILIYMETIGDARGFLSAAREVALQKPIVVIKPGRTEAAARAAASHTGSLAGSDDVLDAALRRCGVLRVQTISELFSMAEALGKQPRPGGPRLAIVTNAGGPAVIATDALMLEGGQLAELAPETLTALDGILPAHWSHGNPVDVLGDADPDRYAKAVEIVARDPGNDGLLVVLTPQAMTDPTQIAERVRTFAQVPGKPILASWMGGVEVAAGESILNRSAIPTFPYPDTAARVFTYMWRYTDNLRALYETPTLAQGAGEFDRDRVSGVIDGARRAGRTLLTELESKTLLAACGIGTVETRLARSADEAVEVARALGFPVVLKLHSETITHKSDVGGVKLSLGDDAGVRRAWTEIEASVTERAGREHFGGVTVQPMVSLDGYELIVGSVIDAQFGPVLLFGAGGKLVEIVRDRALGLPPLNRTLARRLMERTRIFKALGGVRGEAPVDIDQLADVMVRVGQLALEQPRIAELDINPLLVSSKRIIALDARVILHPESMTDAALPRPAIRPYPHQYATTWRTTNGMDVGIRPIRPEDEPRMAAFHETLSERSVYMRYLHPMRLGQRVEHQRLSRICFIDYDREMVLVAERLADDGPGEILGVGRFNRLHWRSEAEFAVLVSDRVQGHGIGAELLRRILAIARAEGVERVIGYISPENAPMLALARRVGFETRRPIDDPTIVEARITTA
jgi:acetyltransferase